MKFHVWRKTSSPRPDISRMKGSIPIVPLMAPSSVFPVVVIMARPRLVAFVRRWLLLVRLATRRAIRVDLHGNPARFGPIDQKAVGERNRTRAVWRTAPGERNAILDAAAATVTGRQVEIALSKWRYRARQRSRCAGHRAYGHGACRQYEFSLLNRPVAAVRLATAAACKTPAALPGFRASRG